MTTDHHTQQTARHPVREVLVLTLACLTYSVLSFLARASESVAVAHARDVVSTERSLGIDIELPVNSWLTTHPMLASLASMQYAVTFFLFTGLTLLTLWVRSPQYYSRARWTLVVMTLGALITYWTYPLAPPRLVPEFGITDAVAQHTSVYSHLFGTLANPYGAMPSMHTGWSVWVAFMLGTYVWRSWWARLIVIFHPILTIMTIIATGNHYIVDAIAGTAYFLVAWTLVTIIQRTLLKNVRSTGETF